VRRDRGHPRAQREAAERAAHRPGHREQQEQGGGAAHRGARAPLGGRVVRREQAAQRPAQAHHEGDRAEQHQRDRVEIPDHRQHGGGVVLEETEHHHVEAVLVEAVEAEVHQRDQRDDERGPEEPVAREAEPTRRTAGAAAHEHHRERERRREREVGQHQQVEARAEQRRVRPVGAFGGARVGFAMREVEDRARGAEQQQQRALQQEEAAQDGSQAPLPFSYRTASTAAGP
jgi:hypothetical protein